MSKPRKLVTLEDLSQLTGHTYRTIRDRLVALEPVEKGGRGRGNFYDSAKALALIYESGSGDPDDLDLSQERAALARMQRRKIELEVAKLEGRLVDADLVSRLVESIVVTVRSRLLSLPRRAAIETTPENPKHGEAILDREARAILEELVASDTLDEVLGRAAGSNGEAVGGVSTAPEADDLPVGGS